MRLSTSIVAALAGVAVAAPSNLVARQSTTSELVNGACKKITLIFARASTEPGNMGGTMGPTVCSGLKRKFTGEVACQGVGQPYTAGIGDNVGTAGTSQAAIGEATKMFNMANTKCPNSIVVAGGYSQGTAVILRSVEKLPEQQKNKIVGIVLFGYTKNAQTKGGIPGIPQDRIKVFCSSGDGVCGGQLQVTAGHFSYMTDGSGPKSIDFLVSKIQSAGSSGGGEAGSPASSPAGKGKGPGGKGKGGMGGQSGVTGPASVEIAE